MELMQRRSEADTGTPVVVEGARVFFFMDVKHDAAGKPITGEVRAFDKVEHSKYAANGVELKAEYKSVDAQNVCSTCLWCHVGHQTSEH